MDPRTISPEGCLSDKTPDRGAGWNEVQRALIEFMRCSLDMQPAEAHFEQWLIDLPYPQQAFCAVAGFEDMRDNAAFRGFHHELLVFSLDNYLRERLGPELVAAWSQYLDLWAQDLKLNASF